MPMKLGVSLFVLIVILATGATAQDPSRAGAAPANPPTQQADPPKEPTRIRVGGNVASSKITHLVQPVYPETAKAAHISGAVVLRCVIAKDGTIMQLTYVSGPPLLLKPAMDAVRQWTYQPTLLNGKPVEVETTISVVFTLGGTVPADSSQQALAPASPEKSDWATGTSPSTEIDPQFKGDVLRLMDLSHFKDKQQIQVRQLLHSMRPTLLATIPVTPNREKIVDRYVEKLGDLFQSEEFTARVVALYAQDLTESDVKAAIAFYETPAGQHYLESAAKMMPDLMAIGQQVALRNVPTIVRDLCNEYPELQGVDRFCAPPDPDRKSILLGPDPRDSEISLAWIFRHDTIHTLRRALADACHGHVRV
jgi:TonB family protein